jgi:ZIP family zinc transporter
VGAAIGWGSLAAVSLVIGAVLGLVRSWSDRTVGIVLSFGAGALISAVSFELTEEGIEIGGTAPVAIGLAVGAVTYFVLDRVLERSSPSRRHPHTEADGGDEGVALALGAFLDGVPEQLVLGIGLAAGEGVSVSLLVAIFVSNLPEAIGSVSDRRRRGRSPRFVLAFWIGVTVVCALATVAGYALADVANADAKATANGFAAGALLVMLVDSMIPDARGKAGRGAGLVTVLGFAAAAGLSTFT